MKRSVFYLLLALFICRCDAAEEQVISLNGAWTAYPGHHRKVPNDIAGRTVLLPGDISPEFAALDPGGWVTLIKKIPPIRRTGETLALHLPRLSDVSRVYWNGRNIGALGQREPYVTGFSRRLLVVLPDSAEVHAEESFLSVALYSPNGLFSIKGDLEVGSSAAVYRNYDLSLAMAVFLVGGYFLVGAYHVLLGVRRPSASYNLHFGFFCLLFGLFVCANDETRELVFGDRVMLATRTDQISLYLMPIFFLFFFTGLFYEGHRFLAFVYGAVAVILSGLVLFGTLAEIFSCLVIWSFVMPFIFLYLLGGIAWKAWCRDPDALFLLPGLLLLLATSTYDIMVERGVLFGPYLTRYGFLSLVLGIAILLANRFVRIHNQVEELKQDLESRVLKRTARLRSSLNEIRAIKQKQDGDYYLTSLLLNPLSVQEEACDTVSVDFFIKQHKCFEFKQKRGEIGGDFCAASRITLFNKNYTVFVNADAMGKSMQGASGALVLGTVFNSIVNRTRLSNRLQRKFPEQWLKECLLDIQSVFVSFRGSMYISAFLGLVDETNGALYYINAEHPGAVLLRHGRACFLDAVSNMGKVGTEGLPDRLQIMVFAMKPDDVIIGGSDGRDDIDVSSDGDSRKINSDEKKFLELVQSRGADLREIYESLLASGSLTDDLSLIKIKFRGTPREPSPEKRQRSRIAHRQAMLHHTGGDLSEAIRKMELAHRLNRRHPGTVRRLASFYFQAREYARAAELLEKFSELDPSDEEIIYAASVAFRKTGDFDRALDFGERLRLRNPENPKNISHLSTIYARMGNFDRASRLRGSLPGRKSD